MSRVPTTYRPSRWQRFSAVASLMVFAAFILLGVFVLADGDWRGGAALLFFGGCLVLSLRPLMRMLTYRLELGRDWIEARSLVDRRVRLPFHEIALFSERLRTSLLEAGGFEFALTTEDGRRLVFSTDLPGWAAAIGQLHRSIPWRVPAPSELAARQVMWIPELSPLAEQVAAPGQDIPEEWAWGRRARARDYVVAYLLAFAIVGPLTVAGAVWLIRGRGLPEQPTRSAAILVCVMGVASIAQWYRSHARARRTKEAEARAFLRQVEDPEGHDPASR